MAGHVNRNLSLEAMGKLAAWRVSLTYILFQITLSIPPEMPLEAKTRRTCAAWVCKHAAYKQLTNLENYLHRELQNARVVCARHLPEVRRA